MSDLGQRILKALSEPEYKPLKPKALGRALGFEGERYEVFKKALKALADEGRIEVGKGNLIRTLSLHRTITGTLRKTSGGFGFVRPAGVKAEGSKSPEDIFIQERDLGDATTGDVVLVRLRKGGKRGTEKQRGEIVRVVERANHKFVGTYFERDDRGLVRVDGTVFAHSVAVGDPGSKGVIPQDKVVIEMIRFPTQEDRGEAVIVEVLGPRGKPGVDALSIMRAFGLPDEFPPDALEEARVGAERFSEKNLEGREDFTGLLTITIDPVDARDFDDAISLSVDPKSGHWQLGVHIADVGHFAPAGGALDREARKRATSVYLPRKVIPMFPELISNSLASLQEGRVRFVKSAFMDFTPDGKRTSVRFANGAIKTRKRFAYEEVSEILSHYPGEQDALAPGGVEGEGGEANRARGAAKPKEAPRAKEGVDPEVLDLLIKGRALALILKERRIQRGALELSMPEAELEFDADGRVTGAHFRSHDISHQLIEEFMLAANEAVAEFLDDRDLAFLRRVHPAPEPNKLKGFAEFARILGYKIKSETDRYALQRILRQSADQPEVHAVHYALLRSLKQAVYSPDEDEHYALASQHYCHFTSPIRRYPDLTVHRLLDAILKKGKAGSDFDEMSVLGDHCSKMERRAETAERELIKLKLLAYMSDKLGMEMEAVITGVADYGFFCQVQKIPVEGMVHISTLPDDFYYYEDASHSLIGQRTHRRFRLGDKVNVKVVRVDQQRRQIDFRLVEKKAAEGKRKRMPELS